MKPLLGLQSLTLGITGGLDERLERGELVSFSPCAFALPEGPERSFLCQQRLSSSQKNISYDADSDLVTGFVYESDAQEDRLTGIMRDCAQAAVAWLATVLPRYARAWRPEQASFCPEEEATRKSRLTAREDLLHIDAFPSRPTQGYRILHLYVNIHPTDPRVWVTSETFDKLLRQYGMEVGLPNLVNDGWAWRFGQGLFSIFQAGNRQRTVYDRFMLRFQQFLKTNDRFQEHSPKRFWHFSPGTAWLAFTDSLSHADLRGRFALEYSFLIAPHTLALPDYSPAASLERVCGMPVIPRAA